MNIKRTTNEFPLSLPSMSRRLIYVVILLFTLSMCKKENPHPQWDIEVIGPLLHSTLGIGQLVGDSSIETLAGGTQVLNYDTVFSNFNIDSLYQVADTTIPTVVIFPQFPSIIHRNTPFSSNNNNIKLGIGSVQLKQSIIFSGKIRLEIKNTLHSKINYIYSIPKAKKNGQPFSVNFSIDSASNTNPKFYTGDYDFSGYDIDMTGIAGISYNTITYNVEARSDPNGYDFNVNAFDTMVNLKTTLIGIEPFFVKGYLGQAETHEINNNNIGINGFIKSGNIKLDSVKLNLDIINYIGADEQVYLNYFSSHNTHTGTTVDLFAPSFVKNYLNINRAYINLMLADSLIPTHHSVQLDKNNSNIKDLIENIPDKFNYDVKLLLNPLGNNSGGNDFVFRDKLINTHLQIIMPLRFATNQLVLADTVPFSISNATNFDPIGLTNLTLIADNGFPFNFNVQLFLLDNTKSITDSMFVPDMIKAAPYDVNYRATGTQRTEIKIPVDANRKQRLLSVQRIGIRLQFNTPDFPQLIQMYSDYRVEFKLVADGIYSLR